MEDLEQYRPALRRFLARRMVAYEEIDDLVQEVFLRVHAAAAKKPLRSPKTFLFTTAKNLIIDRQRRRFVRGPKWTVEDFDEIAQPQISPEESASNSEQAAILWGAIKRLPPRCRIALVLRKFHHLSYKEIATEMEISEKTVEKHLARALTLCQEHLSDMESSSLIDFEEFRLKRLAANRET